MGNRTENMNAMKELKPSEMEQISGGWEYDGDIDWLKGINIQCPYCGAEGRETVQNHGRSKLTAGFKCSRCNNRFQYINANGKVYVNK